MLFFFFSSRRRHTRLQGDWSSDVCSSDLQPPARLVMNQCRGEPVSQHCRSGCGPPPEPGPALVPPRRGCHSARRREIAMISRPLMDTARLDMSMVTGTSPGGGSTLLIVGVPALPLSVIGALDYEELN